MLLTLLVLLLVFALLGGSLGYSRGYGYYGWSPAGLLLFVLVLALLFHWF